MVPFFDNCSKFKAITAKSHDETEQKIAQGDVLTSVLFQYSSF
jgi:hypothetical protein